METKAPDTPDVAGEAKRETEPPKRAENTGVAMHGDYPLNHRLRAQALAAAGKDKDPDNLVTDDAIAGAAEVLARRKTGAAKDDPLKTLKSLGAHVATVTEVEPLTVLRAREVSGENRSGALTLIDERIAAINSGKEA